jgi:hypothetical protein
MKNSWDFYRTDDKCDYDRSMACTSTTMDCRKCMVPLAQEIIQVKELLPLFDAPLTIKIQKVNTK